MKRMHITKAITLLAVVLMVLAGCTKNFREYNTDPTLVTADVIKPSLLFSSVIKNSIFSGHGTGPVAEYSGYYENPASGNVFQNRNWDNPFSSYYRQYIINIAEVIRLTNGVDNLSNQNAIARIWKVWLYHQLTDAYGDIPYYEAAKNVNELVTQPRYDTQQEIYADLFKELKEAAAQLSTSADQLSFGNADFIYKGNVDKWKRFANSLRLRLALRVRYADETLSKQQVNDVIGQPLIETNDQNAFLLTLSDGNTDNQNFMYTEFNRIPGNILASFTTTDNLKKLNDPRLPVFAKPAVIPAAGYRGVPIQLLQTQKDRYPSDSSAHLGAYMVQQVFPIMVMNAAEVKFLRAEAALAGFTTEDEQQLFAAGIQDAMEQLNVSGTDITTYLASAAGILIGTDEEKLEQIIVQKWLGNFFQANEGWAEFSRTGYPRIWVGGDLGDTQGSIPRRLTYPVNEFFLNADNANEAVARISGGDKLTSKVWWDQKPGVPFAHPKQGMFPPE